MSQEKTRFFNLDVLRVLAALGVCFYHFNWYDRSALSELFAFGYLGVNVFFCISGYITPLVLMWSNFSYRDTGRFLLSRLFRLYPAFAIIALIEIIFYACGNPVFGYGQHLEDITWSRTLANYLLYADFVGEAWYVPVFWTLGVEAQFVVALLVCYPLLAHRKSTVRVLVVLVWALAPLCVDKGATILSYGALYAMGMAVFLKMHRSLPAWLFVGLLACAFYGHYAAVSSRAAWTAMATALMVAYVPQMSASWAQWLKIGYLGKLSYSFFLMHITFGGAVMSHLKYFPPTWPYQLPGAVLATLLAGFASALFYRWVESPFHDYARKMKAQSV
ncbi:MAG: acyltransferase [Verrucomicrobiae bacterium]|nr:acyltransferase [Verrucomicrobiae bacterium]NNJ44136.1 acyltransferase [Akkermansiaceae bacterium]